VVQLHIFFPWLRNHTDLVHFSSTSVASQDAGLTLSSGSEITALDINHAGTHAVVAGREILQTIRVNGSTCYEETNLRAAVRDRERQQPTRTRDGLDFHAVKWSHGQFSTYIAAAATNGKIVVYDLNRPGIEIARLHEHHRQVHCLAINPFQGHMLLSGSQDATVKLWDLRDTRSEAMMCRSRLRYTGQSDGIRSVRWSPKDGVEFAFGTDGGVVQGWDYRNPKSAKLRINAHDRACTAIDWHPDGVHLLSASQDRTVLVWDFSTDARRPKPQWTLRTPYPVFNAKWRPPCWNSDTRGQGAWQCTQIATSYERLYPTVHLWDFRRVYMPFRELRSLETAPSDMLWPSQDLLWTVNREGRFQQADIHYAPKVIDRRPFQALAVSSAGELCVFSQKRGRRRGSEMDYAEENDDSVRERSNRTTASEKTQLSRGSFDDSVDENFLISSHKRHHERRHSNRTSKSLSSTPPSLSESGVVKLDETLREGKGTFTQCQVAYRVPLDGTLDSLVFSYLAQKYKHANLSYPVELDAIEAVSKIFEQNAIYAQRTGLYRLTQSWRMFGAANQVEMLRSARTRNLLRRTLRRRARDALKTIRTIPHKPRAHHSGRPVTSSAADKSRRDLLLAESNSNAPTPLARPQTRVTALGGLNSGGPPDPSEDDQFALPDSISPHNFPQQTSPTHEQTEEHTETVQQRSSSATQARASSPHLSSPITTPQALQERRSQLSGWRARPKSPLSLEGTKVQKSAAIDIAPPFDRHNSNESFAFFSASSESQQTMSLRATPEHDGNLASGHETGVAGPSTAPPQANTHQVCLPIQAASKYDTTHHSRGPMRLSSCQIRLVQRGTNAWQELEAVEVTRRRGSSGPVYVFPELDGRRHFGDGEDELPFELEDQLKAILFVIGKDIKKKEKELREAMIAAMEKEAAENAAENATQDAAENTIQNIVEDAVEDAVEDDENGNGGDEQVEEEAPGATANLIQDELDFAGIWLISALANTHLI